MQQGDVLADRYELRTLLGGGGMGEVWAGWDRRLRREVAVKSLHRWIAGSPEFVARFEREAIAAARIKHPNVVSVYDSGTHGDALFLVMERVEGTTLAQLIGAEGTLVPERAMSIAQSVCQALGAAHRAGVVHLDIKPHNIMFDRDGVVKVVDFGIAGFVLNTLTMSDASRLAPAGTPDYGAPEQFGPGGGDERSDLYALGGVLFAMLTGRPPYTGPNAFAVINVKMLQPVPRVEQLRGGVPLGLGELIAGLLDRDPALRPQTAAQVAEQLNRIQKGLQATQAVAPGPSTPVPGPTQPVQTQRPPQQSTVIPQPQAQPAATTWSEVPPPLQPPPFQQLQGPTTVHQDYPGVWARQLPPPAPPAQRTRRSLWPSIIVTAAVAISVGGVLAAYSYAHGNGNASATGDSGTSTTTTTTTTAGTATTATTPTTQATQATPTTQATTQDSSSTGSTQSTAEALADLPDPCEAPTEASISDFDLGAAKHMTETGSISNTSKACYWLTLDDDDSDQSYVLLSVAYFVDIGSGGLPAGSPVSLPGVSAYESTATQGECSIYWATTFGAVMVAGGANQYAAADASPGLCDVTLDWARAIFANLPN